MNCYQHPDRVAAAYCRSCGRALCVACQRLAEGTVFCAEHAPASAAAPSEAPYGNAPPPFASPQPTPDLGAASANPYMGAAPPPGPRPQTFIQTSPGLALLLGLIPGVGAIYNGQYVKGLLHAATFGLLTSMLSAGAGAPGEVFLSICTGTFFCYMPLEAYHTARKRQLGLPVDEWSSLVTPTSLSTTLPVGPILLILVGIVFLLQSLHLLDFEAIARFWPIVLIVAGAVMLYARLKRPVVLPGARPVAMPAAETSHE
jgi:hypothetical protein